MATDDLKQALQPRALARPGFEIWFAVLGDKETGRAFWVRRSHLRTAAGNHGSVVWASLYDANAPQLHASAAQLFADVGPRDPLPSPNVFGERRLAGAIATARGELTWALDWQPEIAPHRQGPHWLADAPFIKTKTVIAAPRARFRGDITLAGRRLPMADAHGIVYHIWGSRRAWDLRWVYAANFDDDAEGWSAEFISARPGPRSLALTWATLMRDGRVYATNNLWHMLTGSSRGELPGIVLRAKAPEFNVEARCRLDQQQLSSYVYRDPGGRPTYIAHSDTSAIELQLDFGGRTRTLRSRRNAAVEFHGPAPWGPWTCHDPYRGLF